MPLSIVGPKRFEEKVIIDERALLQSFQRDGFVHLPGFMGTEEMAEIEARVQEVIECVVPSLPKTEAMYENYDRRETLKQVNVPAERAPALVALRASAKILGLVEGLLAEKAVPQSLELFIKPPKIGTPTPPHQDGFYFCLEPSTALTAWLALDDMDDENGTLHYVAGSHKNGVLTHGASQVLGFSQGVTAGDLAEFGREVGCPLRRGDLLVHDSLTIHRAEGNTSTRLRRALAMVYYGKSAQRDEAAYRRYQDSVKAQQQDMGVH